MDAPTEMDGEHHHPDPSMDVVQGCDQKAIMCGDESYHEVCAVCLEQIPLLETAIVKGCDHAYCVNCILEWTLSKNEPTCPLCKNPFEHLYVHRSLDGRIHDYMFEESVCLLLRASWFNPLIVDDYTPEEFYPCAYENEDDEDEDETFVNNDIRVANQRRGNNVRQVLAGTSSSLGRRARRRLKKSEAPAAAKTCVQTTQSLFKNCLLD